MSVDTDLTTSLRLAVMRIGRTLRQESTRDDVSASMLSALSTVERRGPISLGDLAGSERVSPPSMTRIVGHLEERGLVEREGDATDRRVSRLRITPTGRQVLSAGRKRKDAYLSTLLAGLSADELERLAAALPVLERLAGEGR